MTRFRTDPSALCLAPIPADGSGIRKVAVLGPKLEPSFASVSDECEPTVITRTPLAALHRQRLSEKLQAERLARAERRREWLIVGAWCFAGAFIVGFAGRVIAGLMGIVP